MSINQFFMRDFQKHLDAIQTEHNRALEDNARLRRQVEEWNKDEEIQKAAVALREARRHSLHNLTDLELDKLNEFCSLHSKQCKKYSFGYFISECGIG